MNKHIKKTLDFLFTIKKPFLNFMFYAISLVLTTLILIGFEAMKETETLYQTYVVIVLLFFMVVGLIIILNYLFEGFFILSGVALLIVIVFKLHKIIPIMSSITFSLFIGYLIGDFLFIRKHKRKKQIAGAKEALTEK